LGQLDRERDEQLAKELISHSQNVIKQRGGRKRGKNEVKTLDSAQSSSKNQQGDEDRKETKVVVSVSIHGGGR